MNETIQHAFKLHTKKNDTNESFEEDYTSSGKTKSDGIDNGQALELRTRIEKSPIKNSSDDYRDFHSRVFTNILQHPLLTIVFISFDKILAHTNILKHSL